MSLEIAYQDDGKPTTLKLPLYNGLRLGRAQLGDKRISETHAIFEQRGGTWYVHDCSTNGSWLNEVKLLKDGPGLALRDGDVRTAPSPPHNGPYILSGNVVFPDCLKLNCFHCLGRREVES